MKSWLKVIFLIWLLSSTNVVFADLKPVFNVDACAWNSNQVVVVELFNLEKSTFKVLEVWKGDLKIGEDLVLPFMHNFINLFNAKEPNDRNMGISMKITANDCKRMVLFLNKDSTGKLWPSNFNSELYDEDKENHNFLRSLMRTSMAWIGNDGLYGYVQNSNPGPLEYSKLYTVDYKKTNGWMPENWSYYTENTLKQRIEALTNFKNRLYINSVIPDTFVRADSLIYLFEIEVIKNYHIAADEVLIMLSNCGMGALHPLQTALQDTAYNGMLPAYLWRFAQVGGKKTEQVVLKIAQDEIAFWKSKPVFDNSRLLQLKTGELFYSIYSLAALPYPGCSDCKEMVKDFKAFWLENPHYGMRDEILNACQQVLD